MTSDHPTARSALLAELAKTGALALIYAHIGSLSNAQDGLLAKKAAMQLSGSGPVDTDIDSLFSGSDDDTLNFNF